MKRKTPHAGAISQATLAIAISHTNNRIRSNGLSAREILMKRNNYTDQSIEVDDKDLKKFRYEKRLNNHPYSEKSKAGNQFATENQIIAKGDVVHVKGELTKHNVRDMYLVTSIDYERRLAEIQKFHGNQLKAKKYVIKLSEIYLAYPYVKKPDTQINSEDEDGISLPIATHTTNEIVRSEPTPSDETLRRSTRTKKKSDWLATEDIQRT